MFAGLRPLVAAAGAADTTRLSREHRLFSPLPGLTAIAGGKYTTYRVMARDAVDAAARDLGGSAPSVTARVPLVGAGTPPAGARLGARHGSCAGEVAALAESDPALALPLPGADHYAAAEAVHACTHQGALDLDDVLTRRTRVSIEAPDRGRAAAAAVAPLSPRAGLVGCPDGGGARPLPAAARRRAGGRMAADDASAAAAYGAVMAGQARAPGP